MRASVLIVDSVLNVKVAAFNQEKALVGVFSVIVQLYRLIGYSTTFHHPLLAEVQLAGRGNICCYEPI